MNRKILIAAVSSAAVLAAGAAFYFTASKNATPGRAIPVQAELPTKPDWAARVTPLVCDGVGGVVDGAATASRFSDPFGAVADPQGNVFVADGATATASAALRPTAR
ncbi:hypothetical protein [Massilia sp. Se16.2.3]|uniref:hypothetical protein n=1 Tax=Massilia sp. Se16.2.3 TaxID=2709303 RepID=UPI001E4445ED|nr:hypothetical protein [Massilia sp. Se16.2.3]